MATPAGAAALVFTHLAAVPAAVFLLKRHAWTTLTVLSVAVIISTAYHVCQVGWFCFGSDVRAFQISDHFTVYFAVTWFLLWGSGAPERVVTSATFGIVGLVLPLIIGKPDSWVSGILIISAGVVAFLACYTIYTRIRGKSTVNWLPLLAAGILIASGVVFHVMAGDFSEDNTLYPIAHSIWHVFALLALYFAAMVRYWAPSAARATKPARRAVADAVTRVSGRRNGGTTNLADIKIGDNWSRQLLRG